jgi:hypothetical protein
MTIDRTTESTKEALEMLEDVSARARAMNLGLVAYPVEDVEAVCAALRAVRGKSRLSLQPVAE